jgi:xanthine dehydrogenase accessory factor
MIRGELAQRAERLVADHVPFAVATVVRAQHPTSVRAGDSALVSADGTIEGFVGGVCAESSVRLHGLRALETGESLLLRLVPEGAESVDSFEVGEGAVVVRNPCLSGGSLEIFLEPVLPALRVTVVGTAPIARALADVARAAGYDVVRASAGDVHPQPGDAAVIVASHGSDEERVLGEALTAGVPYVALVASATRGAAVRAALEVPDELRAQLHTPAGLGIGANTPAEIAIAILAQLVAERHANPARDLPPSGAAATPGSGAPSANDPICGMEVAVSEAALHLDTARERVFFCSERCRDAFAEQHLRDAAAP